MRTAGIILAAVAVIGCNKLKRGSAEGGAVDAGISAKDAKLKISAAGYFDCEPHKCAGGFELSPEPRIKAYFDPKTVVEVGGERFVTDQFGALQGVLTKVPLKPAIKDLPLKTLCAEDPTTLGSAPVTLVLPDGTKLSTDYTFTTELAERGLWDSLSKLEKGPVAFPWDKGAAAKGKRAALHLTPSGCTPGGPADATLGDVTVVALTKERRKRDDKCEYRVVEEKSGSSRGTKSGKLTMNDELVKAYERVTGKVLGEKLFEAPHQCTSLEGQNASHTISDQSTYVSEKAVAAWAASFAK
jgi:hypothetical protein